MRVTRKSDYGLRALFTLAKYYDQMPVSIAQIASDHGIPDPFLEKIMQELREAGLVEAVHGRGGGYILTRPPTEISVKDVVRALEGKIALVVCLDPDLVCQIESGCPTSSFWALINEKFEQSLEALTLADMLEDMKQAAANLQKGGRPWR